MRRELHGTLSTFRAAAVAASLLLWSFSSAAQQSTGAPGHDAESMAGYESTPQFGGRGSVGAQVKSDDKKKALTYRFEGIRRYLQPYYDFKARVNKEHGLAFGADYAALYQSASQSLGESDAAGGAFRVYGTWTLLGRDSADSGSLTLKVENRHRLGTQIAPEELGAQVGYAGLTAEYFSNAGWLLTNFFWQQTFEKNRVGVIGGIVDSTDYVDVYGLDNSWTDFLNSAFSTNPTIPAPDQGLGAAAHGMITQNWYLLAGLADSNGDPSNPRENFDTFFNDREYFTHIEIGRIFSWNERFTDNVHLTAWHADERRAAGIPDGWGVAFSFNKKLPSGWLPFVRAGYSDGGGAPLDRALSIGVGYFPGARDDELGIGLSWGRPSEETFGSGLRDQYAAEFYYRFQLFQHMSITPDIQYLINPALNPTEDRIWILGLRGRISF